MYSKAAALVLAVCVLAGGCRGDAPLGIELEGTGLVLEDGTHGPELCLGAVHLSDPPQCRGLTLVGWDWDAVDGERATHGTMMTNAHVRGRLQGNVFTLTARPGPAGDVTLLDDPPHDWSPGCDQPAGDPAVGREAWSDTRATEHPEVVAAWGSDQEGKPFAATYLVRPGAAEAMTALVRQQYAGLLCVVERDQPTRQELASVLDRLDEVTGQKVWLGHADERAGVVRALVTFVDGSVRRKVEQAFGAGRTDLRGALTPAD